MQLLRGRRPIVFSLPLGSSQSSSQTFEFVIWRQRANFNFQLTAKIGVILVESSGRHPLRIPLRGCCPIIFYQPLGSSQSHAMPPSFYNYGVATLTPCETLWPSSCYFHRRNSKSQLTVRIDFTLLQSDRCHPVRVRAPSPLKVTITQKWAF